MKENVYMKREKMSRVLCTLLAAVMLLLCLAACGGGDEDKYIYVPEYIEINQFYGGMDNVNVLDDVIYFTSSIPVHADGAPLTDEEINEYFNSEGPISTREADKFADVSFVSKMFKVKTDGTELVELSDYTPPTVSGDYSYAGLNKLSVDAQGNVWVLESTSTTFFDLPQDYDETKDDLWQYYDHDEQSYSVRKLSNTGKEITAITLEQGKSHSSEGSYYSINHMALDSAGNVYIADSDQDSNQNIYVYSPEGSQLFTTKTDGQSSYINSLICLGDGKVYAFLQNWETGKSQASPIDLGSKDLGEALEIPDEAYSISSGGSVYDFCYTDSETLYGYNFKATEAEKVITWINNDIDSSSISYSTIIDENNILALGTEWGEDGNTNSYILNLIKTKASDVSEKTELSLAVMSLDYSVRAQVLKFNKSNSDYRIKVIDYSQYNTSEDYTAGMTKLNTEIIAGNIPDIIAINDFSYDQYAAKGILEDLYTYIDSDKELSRDSFVQSMLKVQENDGKLYHIGTSFTVNSLVGAKSVLGGEPGWTISEMQELIRSHPEADCALGQDMTREQILGVFLMGNLNSYINWETGKSDFDSEEFKNLLTFAKEFPSYEDMDWNNYDGYVDEAQLIAEGRQLMSYAYLYGFTDIQYYPAVYGEEVVFKGFPSADRNGNIAYITGNTAMTTACENKEGAWQFIRSLITEDAQKDEWNGLPINQKVFDDRLAEAMKQEYDEDGNPISNGGMGYGGGNVIEFYALSREDADLLLGAIDSVVHVQFYDNAIMELINDETAAFFSGEKSVDDVAAVLQSRMNIYINEQR